MMSRSIAPHVASSDVTALFGFRVEGSVLGFRVKGLGFGVDG